MKIISLFLFITSMSIFARDRDSRSQLSTTEVVKRAIKLERKLNNFIYSQHPIAEDPWFISLGGYNGSQSFASGTDRDKGTDMGAFGIVSKKNLVVEVGFEKYDLKYRSSLSGVKYSQNGYYLGYSHINNTNTDKYRYFANYVKGSTSSSLKW